MSDRRKRLLLILVIAPVLVATALGADKPSVLEQPALDRALKSFANDEYSSELGWFAADEREGREPGTRGSIEAGDWAAAEFARLGLAAVGDVIDGKKSYFQYLDRGGKRGLLPGHRLSAAGADFVHGKDWAILGGCDKFSLEGVDVVFTGYGITASEYGYDDYEGIDVEGKAVLILRYEPQEKNKNSAWNGARNTRHSYFQAKLDNAREHGAVAVLFVNGPLHHDPERDPLSGLGTRAGRNSKVPMVHVRGSVADHLLGRKGLTLEGMQRKIDKAARPESMSLGVSIDLAGEVGDLSRARNVVGFLEGSDSRLKDEVIVIGAHYDHLGFGAYGARDPSRKGEVHNGADDNGSGSIGVIELAEAFVESGIKPRRSLVFMLFDAEEKGLIGSNHYVQNPCMPIENTVGMINLDMIAHSTEKKCSIMGTGTAKEWEEILKQAENGSPLTWRHSAGGGGGSDHAPFMRQKIPVLFFFTGIHDAYHSPDDDLENCNIDGAIDVLHVVFRTLLLVDDREERMAYSEPPRRTRAPRVTIGVGGKGRGEGKEGFVISRIVAGGGAEKAGLVEGDVILEIGEDSISGTSSIVAAIKKRQPGETVTVRFLRGDEESEVQVVLSGG